MKEASNSQLHVTRVLPNPFPHDLSSSFSKPCKFTARRRNTDSSALRVVLVVQKPSADEGTPLQGVLKVEGTAEVHVGRGEEEDWEVDEPVEDPGSACRWEVRPGSTGFPSYYGCAKAGAT